MHCFSTALRSVAVLVIVWGSAACTSDAGLDAAVSDAADTSAADSADADTSSPDAAGGVCCPIDLMPACCMRMGGWSDSGQCGQVCDFIVVPSDPGWSRGTDSHGCAVWIEPAHTGRQLCGWDSGSPTDGATDASGG
jgi:hypothetical protein